MGFHIMILIAAKLRHGWTKIIMAGSDRFSLTRRRTLRGIAAITGVGATTAPAAFAEAATANASVAAFTGNVCFVTPRAVEGPFYFDPKLVRADITEGRSGVPLSLTLHVVEAAGCKPVSGARVDIWHADALGMYSGYARQGDAEASSTKGQTFLRGTQITASGGDVTFKSIYPGWYRGRTTHIHFKVFLDSKSMVTGQIYFPDALSQFIYENIAPYKTRNVVRDTINVTDGVLKESGGEHTVFCSVKEEADRYLATLVIGINRDAPLPEMDMRGPPPPGMGPPPGSGMGPPPTSPPVQRDQLVPPIVEKS